MPRLGDDHEGYESDDSENVLEQGARHAKNLFSGFLDFAIQGNVLEIAFGLM